MPRFAACALALNGLGCSLVFPSDEYRGGAASLDELCSSDQVLRCFGFDSQAEIDALYVLETCVDHAQAACYGVVDTDVKYGGEGALRFVVPGTRLTADGTDDVGSFGLNFSPGSNNEPPTGPYPIEIGPGSSVYVSWAQRINAQMLDASYATYGWNAATLGPGDREGAAAPFTSNMAVSAGTGTSYTIPQVWGTLYTPADGCRITDATILDTKGRLLVQNAVGCSFDQSDPGCFFYAPDTWQRFELALHFGGFEATSSRVELWAAREGEPAVQLIDLEIGICEPPIDEAPFNTSYGKVWLAPSMPYRASVGSDGFIWYDDLVISRAPVIH